MPLYDLILIAIGPLVLAALWLLFTRTRWGTLVRAATEDRDMVAALGVDQQRLFTTVFALGAGLAGYLGGRYYPAYFAIGGGHVLHVLSDLSIAATTAKFGQVGPRVGSFDAGFGSAYLARVVGEKRARQIWFLCEQYDAETAERWGLVNKVVEPSELMDAAMDWALKVCALSPTALKALKHSFNADTDHIVGIQSLAFDVLDLYGKTEEAKEGGKAFAEKRQPDFGQFRN